MSISLTEALYWIIPIAVLLIVYWLIPSKGAIGEIYVSILLRRLPKDRYRVINNLLIRNNGRTTQIDHVVVSIYGIFVIETKAYKGWISGGEYSDYWTQNIYGHKYRFRNPIHQNYGHIKVLENILYDYPGIPYTSIIGFPYRAQLRVSSKTLVIHWHNLISVINRNVDQVMSEKQMNEITETLLTLNSDSRSNRKEHVRSVRTGIKERNDTINSGRCPRCGGTLVLRTGKYGSFYGCSNYPKCRYISK